MDHNMFCITEMHEKEQKKILTTFHRQFRHHPAKTTENISRNVGLPNAELKRINIEVAESCDICKRYKKSPPRPVVSLPMAKKFNDVVAMDLNVVKNGELYFSFISLIYSRFTKAICLKRKLPSSVVKAFILTWIDSCFGAPNKVVVDNGDEFNNKEYLDVMEQYNIEVCATRAESPWSNGVCERNHYVVNTMVEKMMLEDETLQIDEALAHAVNAKNSMQNHNGFTPVQLVTDNLPNLPSVLINGMPAMDDADNDDTRHHLERMYSARRAFTKAKSSEKIKRALNHPVRSCETIFSSGDRICYKRATDNKWRGPAKVIGHLGTKVFIVHGSRVLRCSSSRVILVDIPVQRASNSKNDLHHEKVQEEEHKDTVIPATQYEQFAEEEEQQQQQEVRCFIPTLQDSSELETSEHATNEDYSIDKENTQVEQHELKLSGRNKRTPPYTYWYVVLWSEDGKWNNKDVEGANTVCVPIQQHGEKVVEDAKRAELANWEATEAVDLVENKGQKLISTRWVITEKEVSFGVNKPKARLVVRGFEETSEVQVDAPMASKAAMRMVLAIVN